MLYQYTIIQKFGVSNFLSFLLLLKEINNFIQQGCAKLIFKKVINTYKRISILIKCWVFFQLFIHQ